MVSLKAYFEILRPVNSVMIGFAVVIGELLAFGEVPPFFKVVVPGFFTGFLVCGGAMAINDFYDREIDAINVPSRPIPSGRMSPKEALMWSFVLYFLGVLSSLIINVECAMIAVVFSVLSAMYASFLKSTGVLGNLLVSVSVGVPFLFGGVALGGWDIPELSLAIFFTAVLANMGREITKGIMDIEGDTIGGIKTVAVRFGERTAAKVAALFFFSAVFVSQLPYFLDFATIWFEIAVSFVGAGFVILGLNVVRNTSKENSKKVKKTALKLMAFALICFLGEALIFPEI